MNDRYASDERICQSTSTAGGINVGRHQNSLTENSPASYTTSLSTDTLYWDDDSMAAAVAAGTTQPSSRQHSVKSQSSSTYRRDNGCNAAVKPVKSWDNLTAKAFGGYGFGYEYLDRDQLANGGGSGGQQHMVYLQLKNVKGGLQKHHHNHHHQHHHHNGHQNNHHHHHHHHHNHNNHHHHQNGRIRHPTKSTEALLSLPPQYPITAVESSSVSCEYLDACSTHSGSSYFGYVKNDKASQTDCRRYATHQQQQQPEVTRLW